MPGLLPSKSIKVTYNLNPPLSIPVPANLPKSNAHSYPVTISASTDKTDTLKAGNAFYRGLRKSLDAARNEVGEELTTWRDLVGKAELNKELKKADEDGEEGEDTVGEEGQT